MSEIREWYSLPISDKKRRIRFLILFPLAVLLFWIAGGIFWGIFSLIVLSAVLLPFYTKTYYRIENGKIIIRKPLYTSVRELSSFKRVFKDDFGVFLSPFKNKSILENFRGLYVMIDSPDLREEIYTYLKREIEGDSGRNSG